MISKYALLSVAAIALLCVCSSVLLSSSADADDGNGLTASTESSMIQGNSAYCYIYIESLEDIASLDIQVHYDTEKIDLNVNNAYNSVSCSMYDSSLSDGCLNFSYLFSDPGSDSQTLLFYFMYTVSSEAEPGTTYFDILVNEAYDQSLDPADVSGCRCSFDIAERTVRKNCNVYTNSTQSTSIDGTFDLSYSFNTNQILSGSATVTYDSELFELVSLTNGSFLDGKTVDSNTSLTGSVYLSFVSLEYGNGYDLMTLRFRTLQNVNASSQISMVVSELYDNELDLVQCNGCSTTVNIAYDNTYVEDKPAMYCESSYDAQTDEVTVQIKLESDSHLGAGDFILNFDTSKLTYSESTKGFAPSFFNINDKEVGEGKLKFSIISMEDIVASNTVLTVVFIPIHACTDAETTLTLTGSGLTDSMTETIILNIRGTSQTIPLRHNYVDTVTEPTCTSGGYTTHECSVCVHSYVDSQVDALGHDLIHHDAKAPTCTEVGWEAYDTCSRCDYTTYHELAALGHDLVHHDAKSSTCTEVGWNAYDTCSRCDYTTYSELNALGHDYVASVTEPTCMERGYTTHTCSRCNDSYIDSYTDALNHDLIHHDAQAATCTQPGWNAYDTCSRCNYTTYSATQTLGHDLIHHDAKAPTCTEVGWDAYDTCSRCDYTTYHELSALGHDLIHHDAKAPTCTEVGWDAYDACSRCTYTTYSEIPALDHDYSATITQPTCTEKGYTTHTCSRCGDTYTDTFVDALGHTYSATYDWSADGKRCTVHIVCSNDGSHKHDIADIIAVSSVKTEAAIGSMGVTTYSVSGTYDGFAYFDSMDVRDIPALEPEIVQKDTQGEITYANTVTENQTTQVTEIFNTAKTNSSSVEVSVPTAVTESPVIISFDNDAVNAIGGSEVTITANVIENSTEIEEAELVIEVKLEGATFSEGKAKVTIPLTETVPEGKTVKVYFINGNERTDMNATLVDGNVVFETNHFSTYAIAFEDSPSEDDPGFTLVIIAATVILASAVVVGAVVLKRKN